MRQRIAVLALAALMTVPAGAAPQHSRLFPPEQLGSLEGPDRDAWQRPDQVMDKLLIAEGSVVADLGAGGGWFTMRLANRVGPNGIVYAEDVQPQMIEAITRRDYMTLQGVVLFIGVSFVLVNLIVDAIYSLLDPRLAARGQR